MSRSAAPSTRRANAVESFKNAADTIGPVVPGMSIFAITRGQFSMIDAILHVLEATGPARISLWTWTIADYEIKAFTQLMRDGRITGGTLVIDHGARNKNSALIREWKLFYGDDSVRYTLNHAKIATIEGGGMRVSLRGSMNLNKNPRFEQLDVSEGDGAFDLIREIEAELEELPDDAPGSAVYTSSKVADAFDTETLDLFAKVKTWAK